jgi:hypothetical protein
MKYSITATLYVDSKSKMINAANYIVGKIGFWLDDERDILKITREPSLGKLVFDCRFDNFVERNQAVTAIINNQSRFIKGTVETHDCGDDEGIACDNYVQVAKWGVWDESNT